MVSVAKIRAGLDEILHLHESPHRTALAFAVGVFIAFSPAYGLHTAMVFFCTWAFRLNFVALMLGAFFNNPWTVVPVLGATMWTGVQISGMPEAPTIQWDDLSVASLYQQIMPYLLPFVAGATALSVLGALLGYPVAYFFIWYYRGRLRESSPTSTRLPRESS
jgi:uncharacterized protein (DUF2062 family)